MVLCPVVSLQQLCHGGDIFKLWLGRGRLMNTWGAALSFIKAAQKFPEVSLLRAVSGLPSVKSPSVRGERCKVWRPRAARARLERGRESR